MKLCLGFAKRVLEPYGLRTICGTAAFAAPELLLGQGYDERVDNWSCGVLLFHLLTGRHPFGQREDSLHGRFDFEEDSSFGISKEARLLVGSLIKVDIRSRMVAREALQASWITMPAESLPNRLLPRAHGKIAAAMASVRNALNHQVQTVRVFNDNLFIHALVHANDELSLIFPDPYVQVGFHRKEF